MINLFHPFIGQKKSRHYLSPHVSAPMTRVHADSITNDDGNVNKPSFEKNQLARLDERSLCLFKIPSASKMANPDYFRYFEMYPNQSPTNRTTAQMLRSLFSFLLSLFKSHAQLHLEVLFLRKQLEIVARSSPKLKIQPTERFLMGFLTDLYESCREALLIVQPETVIRWHRQSFQLFWKWKSRSEAGRPKIPQAQIDLIRQMASENPLWGAPRIHGEMLKLGFDISEATVLRYMPKKAPKTSKQRWKTFLKNDSTQIVSVTSSLCQPSPFDYSTFWSSCLTTDERSFTSM